ncbi:MAG: hypothetical protein HFH79_00360 [Lachnospiraceae bacterium]|nr:hypothetical protein [Lachnospiraceae bacterium]
MRTELKNRMTQYAAVMLLTAVVFMGYYILHQFELRELWVYDANKAVDDFVRGIAETGRQQTAFFGFNLQNLVIFMLGRLFGDVILGINLYYVMTFFMISGASYWCMKIMGMSGKTALFISVLLSFVPFHIDRGEGQIITSSFFLVPVFLGLLYQIFFLENNAKLQVSTAVWMAAAPFIDWRLAVMLLLLLLVLTVHRNERRLYRTAGIYAAVLLFFILFAGVAAGMFEQADAAENIRLAREEGLRVLDMILPLRYHVSDRLWNIRYEYDISFSVHGECGLNSQGMLISAAFLYGLFVLFFGKKKDKRIQWLAWLNVVVILISVIGGFHLVLEYMGISLVYWNRMGIIIIVCSAATLGFMADQMRAWLSNRVPHQIVDAAIALTAIAGLAELILRQNM